MRLVAFALVLGLAATAHADAELDEARRLEAALEYDKALAIVTHIIDRGTIADPEVLAELHLDAGRLAAGLDRADEARRHFAIALALDPGFSLPAGTSPKLLAPFEDARATTVPLRLHATEDGRIIADADPLGIVARTELAGHAARAFDAHGNVVWRSEVAPPPPRHVAARWQTWGIVTGGAAVLGGLCAWRFQVAQDDWDRSSQDGRHDYTQLRAIEDRGERWGLAANIGFGVAAAAGITAIVLNVFEARPTVQPAVSSRSVGLQMAF